MSITGTNHYNLRAKRQLLNELRDFYVSVVGLIPGTRPPFKSFGCWLYAGGQDVQQLTESFQDEERSTHVKSTIDHVAFTCTYIHAARARLQQNRVHYTFDEVPITWACQLFLAIQLVTVWS